MSNVNNNLLLKVLCSWWAISIVLLLAMVLYVDYSKLEVSVPSILVWWGLFTIIIWVLKEFYLEMNVVIPIMDLYKYPDHMKNYVTYGLDGYAIIQRRRLLEFY